MSNEQDMEAILKDLLEEIGGPLKESGQAAYDIIEKCAEEDIYKILPEFVRRTVKYSQSAVEESKRAYEEVSRIGSSDESADNKLKYIYDQIAGPIRNCANSFLSFADICDVDSEKLQEEVRQMIQPAKGAWGKFKISNDRISEILGRLPEGKLDEYKQYHTRGKKR